MDGGVYETMPMSGGEPRRELRVLLIEDKSLVAERLTAQLEGLGHRVLGPARNGEEAVRFAQALEPDLVITDVGLPLLDGIETTRTLLAHRLVPIIVLTPYAAADFVQRARGAGVMAHLVRPLDRRPLGRAIEEALARFRELEAIRREARDLEDALEARNRVERAKRVFMRRLKVSEREAFRRLQQQSRRMGTSLGESASAILRAEERLFRNVNVARNLQFMLAALRRGLRRPPARRPRAGAPLPFATRAETEARPPHGST